MAINAVLFKPIYAIGQAVGILIEIRIVDLRRIARENHLRALTSARDDRFDLVRR